MKNKFLIIVLLIAAFLRLFQLDKLSLFGDELDVGYQAYSLMKTGKDYSGNFLPIQPRSLAEWRTPIFIYSTIPTVAIFGISTLGVRLLPVLFGVLNIYLIFILFKKLNKNNLEVFNIKLEIIAAFLMSINPWHIQYSRAAFEVTQMLMFLLLGIIFLLNSLEKNGKGLWLSMFFFMLMPWTYNTPKLFVPLFLVSLFSIYFKKIINFDKSNLIKTILVGVILGLPLLFNIFSGQGSARFSNISLFNDPNLENVISEQREFDKNNSRIFHNKLTYFTSKFVNNYLSAFSPEFLFLEGDSNLRHSINSYGQFYAIEAVSLVLGLIYFFGVYQETKYKYLLASWLMLAPIPSAITLDGANHATRLILILPALVILNAFGVYALSKLFKKSLLYLITLFVSFVYFQHAFYVHNPKESGEWWHAGWKESIEYIKENQNSYDKIIVSTKKEPPWIFYAAYSELEPKKFQSFSPEESNHIDNIYFYSLPTESVYEYEKFLDKNTLYLATAKEVNVVPENLTLLKQVNYPNDLPAYYIFTGK